MLDAVLDWVVVILPTLLSVAGVVVSIKAPNSEHHRAWRVSLIVFGICLSVATFWQQSRTRSSHDQEILGLTDRLKRIEKNTQEPPKVQVTNNMPPPTIIMPPTSGSKPAGTLERARLHIMQTQVTADNRDLITANITVQNVGTLTASMKHFQASSIIVKSDDPAIMKQREAEAELQRKNEIKKLMLDKAIRENTVNPGPPGIWFTHLPGIKLTEEQFSDFKKGRFLLVFSGVIEYSDANGGHKTMYCVSNDGNPSVVFLCGDNREY